MARGARSRATSLCFPLDQGSGRGETRVREEILTLIERELARVVRERFGSDSRLEEAVESVRNGENDPYTAAERILETLQLAK